MPIKPKPGCTLGTLLLLKPKTGKVRPVKKLTCYLLIVWLALMSGGVNAHAHSFEHHSHEAHNTHDHETNSQAMTDEANTLAEPSRLDNNNIENLTQAHYNQGHSHHHATGLPSSCDVLTEADPPSLKPVFYLALSSSAITNNIERPKWNVTTPAVVSLLS